MKQNQQQQQESLSQPRAQIYSQAQNQQRQAISLSEKKQYIPVGPPQIITPLAGSTLPIMSNFETPSNMRLRTQEGRGITIQESGGYALQQLESSSTVAIQMSSHNKKNQTVVQRLSIQQDPNTANSQKTTNANKTAILPRDPKSLNNVLEKLKLQSFQQHQLALENFGKPQNQIDTQFNQELNRRIQNKSLKILQGKGSAAGMLNSQDISYLQDSTKNLDQMLYKEFPELLKDKNRIRENKTGKHTLSTQVIEKYTNDQSLLSKSFSALQTLPQLGNQTMNDSQMLKNGLKRQILPTTLNQLKKIIRVQESQSPGRGGTGLSNVELNGSGSPGGKICKKLDCLNYLDEIVIQKELDHFMVSNNNQDEEFFKNYYLKTAIFRFVQPPMTIKNESQQVDYIAQFFEDVFKRQKEKQITKKEQQTGAFIDMQPNIFTEKKKGLGNPTGRREAQLLQMWFEQMIKSYVGEGKKWNQLKIEEKAQAMENLKCISKICLKEVIRQVSVQCSERGIIIDKIFELNNQINSKDIVIYQEERNQFLKQQDDAIKKLEDEKFRMFIKHQGDLDEFALKVKEENDKRKEDIEMIELLKLKLEAQADKNAQLMKENREKNINTQKLNDQMEELNLKLQKFRDRKRILDKKLQDLSLKEQEQAEAQFQMMRRLSQTNPEKIIQSYGQDPSSPYGVGQQQQILNNLVTAQSRGPGSYRGGTIGIGGLGIQSYPTQHNIEDLEYSKSVINTEMQLHSPYRRRTTYNGNQGGQRTQTSRIDTYSNKFSNLDDDFLQGDQTNKNANQDLLIENTSLTKRSQVNKEDFENFEQLTNNLQKSHRKQSSSQYQQDIQKQKQNKDDMDDISLDSFQLISREDELLNNELDQEDDESNFVKKEILLQKFEQEMEYSNDFEKLLNKAEEIYNLVIQRMGLSSGQSFIAKSSNPKDKKGQPVDLLNIVKDTVQTMFKEDLKLMQMISSKFLKIKDQILDNAQTQLNNQERLGSQMSISPNTNNNNKRVFNRNEDNQIQNHTMIINGADPIQKVPTKNDETQTDFVDFFDYADIDVNVPELYRFEKKSNKLVKIIVDKSQTYVEDLEGKITQVDQQQLSQEQLRQSQELQQKTQTSEAGFPHSQSPSQKKEKEVKFDDKRQKLDEKKILTTENLITNNETNLNIRKTITRIQIRQFEYIARNSFALAPFLINNGNGQQNQQFLGGGQGGNLHPNMIQTERFLGSLESTPGGGRNKQNNINPARLSVQQLQQSIQNTNSNEGNDNTNNNTNGYGTRVASSQSPVRKSGGSPIRIIEGKNEIQNSKTPNKRFQRQQTLKPKDKQPIEQSRRRISTAPNEYDDDLYKRSENNKNGESQRQAGKIMTERNRKVDELLKAEEHIKLLNQTMREQLKKIHEYEEDIERLLARKQKLARQFKQIPDQEIDFMKKEFQLGFISGFQRGLSHGFFKGATENQVIFQHKGVQEGLREGWLAGFEDGAEYGIKKVFKEAFLKGIDLSSLDIKDYIDINKLKREKLNEYERIFNQLEYSDKQERLLRILEDYKSFSKKKKLKYATIGRKNLLKLIHSIYIEKFSTPKNQKSILIEIVYDLTKIKYGNDGIIDKKLYRLFSSAIFHAPSCKKIAIFAKFLMLGKRNLSNEILQFYLNGLYFLRNKNWSDKLNRTSNDEETVALPRALDSFRDLFEKMIPIEIFPTLRNKVEQLALRDEISKNLNLYNVDVDKYLEYCSNIYQRFHLNYQNRLALVFNAWTLYQNNFIYAEEIYLTMKILSGQTGSVQGMERNSQKKKIIFMSRDKREEKTVKEIMGTIKEKLGSAKNKTIMKQDQFIDVFSPSDLYTNIHAQKEIFDQIILFEDQDEMMLRFTTQIRECQTELRNLFFGMRFVNGKIPYLESEEVWQQRLHQIESMINVIHPSLLSLSLILFKKSIQFFRKRIDPMHKNENLDLDIVRRSKINTQEFNTESNSNS